MQLCFIKMLFLSPLNVSDSLNKFNIKKQNLSKYKQQISNCDFIYYEGKLSNFIFLNCE